MVTAMAYPEGRQGKKDTSLKNSEAEISAPYIRQARYVLRNNFTPEGQQYPDRCLAVPNASRHGPFDGVGSC